MAKHDKKAAKQKAKEARRAAKAERQKEARQAQAILPRNQIADQLRALASQVEAGTFVLGDREIELPSSAEYEISYKLKPRGGHEIEVEIGWGDPKAASLLPIE